MLRHRREIFLEQLLNQIRTSRRVSVRVIAGDDRGLSVYLSSSSSFPFPFEGNRALRFA